MAEWYVYQHDGDPLGPWSTEAVAEAILNGKIPPDVWVAAPGGSRWLRALDVPAIEALASGIPTVPRRDSGLRIMPIAAADLAETGGKATVMMAPFEDRALMSEAAPSTTRSEPPPAMDETPPVSEITPTQPHLAVPPSSSSSPRTEARTRRNG
ncbi:MAG: DUF4339 domain-containing protein [Labilithrix sp.]|nr:DUF4339 domain-containing protein [Labilithrix sp.]